MLRRRMYTIKEAAARTGLSVSVIRAWERRYGVVRPARTRSGYRLYDDASLERLRAMRRLVEDGWLPSEAARAIAAQETEPARRASSDAETADGSTAVEHPSSTAIERERDSLVERFVRAAAAHDEEAVEAILDEIGVRGRFEAVVDDYLLPAAAALGDAWATGRLDTAAEHAASNAVLRRLAAAFQAAAHHRAFDRPPLLVGLPPGSRHELGALAFAVAARRQGLSVLYLGADVPIASWIEAVHQTGAWLVVLGVVSPTDVDPALRTIEAVRAAIPGVIVAVGGASAPEPPSRHPQWLQLPGRVVEAASRVKALWEERFAPSTTPS